METLTVKMIYQPIEFEAFKKAATGQPTRFVPNDLIATHFLLEKKKHFIFSKYLTNFDKQKVDICV